MTLIERLEALTGPCRECDIEIARDRFGFDAVRPGGTCWPKGSIIVPCYPGWQIMPAYTASIDAAMTLVPDGCGYVIRKSVKRMPVVSLQFPNDGLGCKFETTVDGWADYVLGHTPAITLCIAALKAKLVAEPTGRAIGGKARADKLTPERRSEIARKAAAARWANNACKEEKAGA